MDRLNNLSPDEEKVLSRVLDYLRDKKCGLNPPLPILSDAEIQVLFSKNRLLHGREGRDHKELQKQHSLTVMPPWRKRELGFDSEQIIYEI